MTLSAEGRIGFPLLLSPSFDAKTWGGRRLEALGKSLPDGAIGESLESGTEARIDGGPFDGISLGSLAASHASALLGRRGQTASGRFNDVPLLVKLIDAQQDLSVQVHPDDATAPPGKRGKTEAWYILEATPGARIVTGIRGPVQISRIEDQLIDIPVSPGDVYFVPAGTVHAIGAGVLLYEIQQASDVTWRLYDWGRPREIHVTQALGVVEPSSVAAKIAPLSIEPGRDVLVACRYFALERWSGDGERLLQETPETFRVLTVLVGEVSIAGMIIPQGTSALLPADLASQPILGAGTFLIGYIPDLETDVLNPLLAAGYDLASIRRLGADL